MYAIPAERSKDMLVYRLRHIYDNSEYDLACPMTLGYFSNVQKANEAIEYYRSIEGYRNYPNGFIIEECNVRTKKELTKLYEAYFSFSDGEDIYEHTDEIGVFDTKREALLAVNRFKALNQKLIMDSVLTKEIDVFEYEIDKKYALDAFD